MNLIHLISALTLFIISPLNSYEIELPEGYEFANLFEGIDDEELPKMPLEGIHDRVCGVPWHKTPGDRQNTQDKSGDNVALVTLEAGPSATVADCVHALTGTFFDSGSDLVIPGAQPLIVQHSYSTSDKSWHFSHLPELEVGKSEGAHHLRAGYRDGSGSGMSFSAKKRGLSDIHRLEITEEAYERGLTNCGSGQISGQTNWKNSGVYFVRSGGEKQYIVHQGSSVKKVFEQSKRYGKKHTSGAPQGKFRILREMTHSGNILSYRYNENMSTMEVKALSKEGMVLGKIGFNEDEYTMNFFSGKHSVLYRFDEKKKKLLNIFTTQGVNVAYRYDDNGYLSKKMLPEGRYLDIEFNRSYGKTRVSALKAPVGVDAKPVVTHTFKYMGDKKRGATYVRDAKRNLTVFEHTKMRLETVTRYDKDEILSKDRFFWGSGDNEGNLVSRVYESNGKCLFCKKLDYDRFGNVIRNELWGNITGACKQPVEINSHGHPLKNGSEVYAKTYYYSQDNRNLLLEEHDGVKSIYCSYKSGTSLIESRLTKANGRILKREFFTHDDAGVVIEEVTDDGASEDVLDLTGVTEIRIKRITPTITDPIGLPETIEEGYLDNGAFCMVKRVVNSYSPEGKILEQDHYGSDGILAYTLLWDYNNQGHVIREVNALGEETIYDYDLNGNKILEVGQLSQKVFTYDLANRLIKEDEEWESGEHFVTTHSYNTLSQKITTTDPSGNEMSFEYDSQSRLIKTSYPPVYDNDGFLVIPTIRTDYDAMGNAVKTYDANGYCTSTEYTVRGQPIRVEYPNGSVETMEYSLDGMLMKKTAKNGLVTAYTYDPFGRVTTTVISDSRGEVLKSTSSSYNTFHVLTETDELGVITYYTYDKVGRKTSETKGHRKTSYQYDQLGRVAKTIEHIDRESARIFVKKYDLLDRVTEETTEDARGNVFTKEEYAYDVFGKRTRKVVQTQAGEATTLTVYNPHGDPVSITDPLGNVTHIEYIYDHLYRDLHVLQIRKTDPLGNQEIVIHDTHGNVSCTMRRNAFGTILQHETHVYDKEGHRLSTESHLPRSIVTNWHYDSMGNVDKLIEACGTSDQRITTYVFNLYGQKESAVTPNGVTITYTYDLLGRLETLKSSDGTVDYSYMYDVMDHPVCVKDYISGTSTLRHYDSYGLLRTETLDNGCRLDYDYDNLDRQVYMTLPDGTAVRYIYNAHFLSSVARVKDCTVLYSHNYTGRDLAGNIISEKLLGNAGMITYGHDLMGRTVSTTSSDWNETIPKGGYDAVGNLHERHVCDVQGTVTYTYDYDDLYQIKRETGIGLHTYANDALYNRTNKDQEEYSYNDLNQLKAQSACQYRYDKNGNLIEKLMDGSSLKLDYDGLDRLVKVTEGEYETHYLYDSFHRRIGKIHNGVTTHFIYDGQNEIGAISEGKITQLRVLGATHGAEIGAAVALELEGKVYAPIHDPYGNVVAMIDDKGRCVESRRYTAFGESADTSALIGNPWGYSSKRLDLETGFIYFGRRYYAPDIGRWITPDPAGFADGLNLYAYVHNDPMAYIDPDGQLAFLLVPFAISCAIDMCLPAAAALAETYLGGAMAAAFVMGMGQGYNADYCGTNPFEAVDSGSYWCGKAGMLVGGMISAGNPKNYIKAAGQALFKGAASAGVAMGEKAVTNMAVTGTKKAAGAAASKTTQAAERTVFNVERKLPVDKFSKMGMEIDRKELTKVGRSLDKHGNRLGSFCPKPFGSPANRNRMGQEILDDILTHPKVICDIHIHPQHGLIREFVVPGYGGVRFNSQGFIGFIEN